MASENQSRTSGVCKSDQTCRPTEEVPSGGVHCGENRMRNTSSRVARKNAGRYACQPNEKKMKPEGGRRRHMQSNALLCRGYFKKTNDQRRPARKQGNIDRGGRKARNALIEATTTEERTSTRISGHKRLETLRGILSTR